MTFDIVTSPLDTGRLPEMLRTVQVTEYASVAPRPVSDRELTRYHSDAYVRDLRDGWSDEWQGRNKELATRHVLAAGGSLRLAERVWRGRARRGFNPHGLRTLPAPDASMWGEAVNDAALAAGWLTRRGLRVTLVDIGRPRPLFAMPGLQEITSSVPNFTGAELRAFIEVAGDLAREFAPDVILYAAASCHVEQDPTTTSTLTLIDYACAARDVAKIADEVCSGRVVAGCGAGYYPDGCVDQLHAVMAATCHGLAQVRADEVATPEPAPAAVSRGGLRLIRGGAL